jgi:hypothetical protein
MKMHLLALGSMVTIE